MGESPFWVRSSQKSPNDGGTKLAMLHPKFMTVLYPDPNLERAVQTVTPLFETMLDEVAR